MKNLLTVLFAAAGIAASGAATRYVASNETVDIDEDVSVDQF